MIEGSRLRLTVIGVIVMFLFSALFARLWFLQVASDDNYAAAATSNRIQVMYEPALRGRIVDRNNRPIVDNQPVDVVTFDRHKQMTPAERKLVVGRLAAQLDVTSEEIEKRIDDPRASPFGPVRIATAIPPEVRTFLEEREAELPGVKVVRTAVRAYPNGPLAANLLGYISEINADELEAHKDEGYREGELIGKDGVEQTFEGVLRGTPRRLKVEVDSRGRVVRTIEERKAVPGKDVKLTLDIDVQRMAEQSLAQGMEGARRLQDQNEKQRFESYRAGAGAVVALDPNDGSVVAMASNPTYDPRQFSSGITPEEFQLLSRPDSNFPLVNRAVQGLYAPGSTFKPFTAIAGLQTGQLDPNAGFSDQGCLSIGDPPEERCNAGKKAHGTVNLPQALTVSSDTYFYDVGRDMWHHYNMWTKTKAGDEAVAEDEISKGYAIQNTAKAYGFDRPTGVGLRDEAGGRVPDQLWKERFNQDEPDPRQKRERSLWLPGDNVNLAVGQGDLLVTPLQLATGYAAFANGGMLFTPRLASALLEPGAGLGQPQPVFRDLPPQPVGSTGLTPENRQVIMEGLIGVTNSGTGTANAAFGGLGGPTVAGKTGTAEAQGKQDTSLFVGISPPDQPQYVVMAVIEEGGFGASVAAPVVARIFQGINGNTNSAAVEVRPADVQD
ncbi:MAG TPA: penicillin-binding protein 2 [Acidimicrobiia bacterium]|nr:penicillin-binding protein 2 [Acidimicrobiia bacterium]